MALKFLNKKGWHTGSLRNIENVWKAEQKHDAEEKKLEELRKQIQDERERSEFRLLQERAGLVPRQERLDFLYESGLAVGKGSSEGFKALEAPSKADASVSASSEPGASKAAVPGALFEDKPQAANDAWRKLHSDPLLLIRQREQEALARIKNNPVQMAMIRKSVESEKHQKGKRNKDEKHKRSKDHKKKNRHSRPKFDKHSVEGGSDSETERKEERRKRDRPISGHQQADVRDHPTSDRHRADVHRIPESSRHETQMPYQRQGSACNYRRGAPKLSEEERAARLREMQLDAEVHEEQRWKRLKKASEDDAREAVRDRTSTGRNFLDAARKSIYGAEKGGSSTIEESVRRRTYYSQGGSAAREGNAFRRD